MPSWLPVGWSLSKADRTTCYSHRMRNALEGLDQQVKQAVVSALMLGPLRLLPLLVAVDPSDLKQVRDDLLDLYSSQLISQAELITQLANIQPGELFMPAGRMTLFEDGMADLELAAKVRRELADRFDALSGQQRQRLVSDLLDIHVVPGANGPQFNITHKVATSLNV